MKIISPYNNIKQYTRISIAPFYMNSELKNNMLFVLKKQLEKKCNKNGYIDEVYKIIEYSDGLMPPENLNGSAIYNITYLCKLCKPIENTIIIGLVKTICPELIICINGPIMIFIPKENVDSNIWDITENFTNKNDKTKLEISNFVKIQILNIRINQNDIQINAIGKLLVIATEEEIDTYYNDKVIVDKPEIKEENIETNIEKSNFII
jgi:DNA-directed RNA polymerase subunit E'/Rpb7